MLITIDGHRFEAETVQLARGLGDTWVVKLKRHRDHVVPVEFCSDRETAERVVKRIRELKDGARLTFRNGRLVQVLDGHGSVAELGAAAAC